MGLRDDLLRLEYALAARDPSVAGGDLLDLVADDFVEFGASGRTWDRTSIAAVLTSSEARRVQIVGFTVDVLAESVALVTYRLEGTNRSSLWVRRDGSWVIRFHQGTRTAAIPFVGHDERFSE